jgi:hypothetical protein
MVTVVVVVVVILECCPIRIVQNYISSNPAIRLRLPISQQRHLITRQGNHFLILFEISQSWEGDIKLGQFLLVMTEVTQKGGRHMRFTIYIT